MKFYNKSSLPGITSILIIILISAFITVGLFFAYSYQSKQYYKNSKSITSELEKEVTKLKNSFKYLSTTVSSREQAKKATKTHLDLTKSSSIKIRELEAEYNNLWVPPTKKSLDEKIISSFEYTNSFVKKYERTAQINNDIFIIFDEELNSKLEEFTKIHYSGGERVLFITKTAHLEDLASDSIKRMKLLSPSDDDKGYYDLKLEHLNNLKTSFNSLNYFYRYSDDMSAKSESVSLTAKTNSINQKLEQNAKDYINNSSVAQDLKKLEELLEQINSELLNR